MLACLNEIDIETLGSFAVLRDLRISTETNERWLTLNQIFSVCHIYHGAKDKDHFVKNISRIFSIKGLQYRTRHSATLYAVQFSTPRFLFGMHNPNVRCYLNVALVACWKTPLLRNALNKQSGAVATEIQKVFLQLDTQNQPPKTDDLKVALKKAGKWQKGHQDAAEMLQYFVELSNLPTNALGIAYSSVYCFGGRQIRSTKDFEKGFNISANNNTSVQNEIDNWLLPTKVKYSLNGSTVEAEKICQLTGASDVVFVNINRFADDFAQKKPFTITLNECITINNQAYVLHLVISHQGSANCGHYRILVNENIKMVWNEYDDSRVIRQTSNRLHELRGGRLCASASFLVYIKQSAVKDLFSIATSNSVLPARTRGRTVSVAFEISDEEDIAPRPKRQKQKKSTNDEVDSFEQIQIEEDSDCSENYQSKTKGNSQKSSPLPSKIHEKTSDKAQNIVAIGNLTDLKAETYTIATERVTKSNVVCVYKVRQHEGERQWLTQWAKPKSRPSVNWISSANASKDLRNWLNTFFKSPHAQAIQGWHEPIALPVYRPDRIFNYSNVGPTTREQDKIRIFNKFIDDELVAKMVVEINRAAHRSFDEANLERQLWRSTKCQSLTEWAQQMEAKYPTLRSNDTWVEKTRTLQDYFKSKHNTSLKDRINYYKEQSKWKDTNVEELKTFIGLMLAIRCVRGRRARDYFCTSNPLYGNEFISSKMSQNRYEVLWNHFHIDLDFLISDILSKCERNWIPSQKVTFDETIIHFLGRFYALQHIPSKPHPNGVLLYLLADTFKYVWSFDFFLGLCLPPQYQLLEMADKLSKLQSGYTIITDSHWGSEEVATTLDLKNTKFLLSCKRDHPSYLFGKFADSMKNSPVGSYRQLIKKGSTVPITAMTYKDHNACINLISNYINDLSFQLMPCNGVPQSKEGKPLIVREYTYAKGYVDEVARQLHTFDWPHKVKKWPIIVWNTLLNICTWNSFIYYQTNSQTETTYREFLADLAFELAKQQRSSTSKLVRPRDATGKLLKHTLGRRHIRVSITELGKRRSPQKCCFCKLNKRRPKLTSHVCLGCSRSTWKFQCHSCTCVHKK